MKRILAALIFAATLFCLCSCVGEQAKDFDLSKGDFTCRGAYSSGENKYAFDVSRTGGELVLVFTSPEKISGLAVRTGHDGSFVSVDGTEIPLSCENPVAGNVGAVFSLTGGELKKTEKKRLNGVDFNLLTFGSDSGDITLYIEPSGGLPIRADGGNFTLEIYDLVFSDGE